MKYLKPSQNVTMPLNVIMAANNIVLLFCCLCTAGGDADSPTKQPASG